MPWAVWVAQAWVSWGKLTFSGFSSLKRLLWSPETCAVILRTDSLRSLLRSFLQVSHQTYSVLNRTHASFTLFSCNLVEILNFLGNTFQSLQLLKHKLVATAPWSPGFCHSPYVYITHADSHAPLSSRHPHNSGCLWSLELHHGNHLLLLLLLLLLSLAHVQPLFPDQIPPGHSSWVIGYAASCLENCGSQMVLTKAVQVEASSGNF